MGFVKLFNRRRARNKHLSSGYSFLFGPTSSGRAGRLYYEYQRTSDEPPSARYERVVLSPAEVLHIPGLGFDGLVGYRPIAMAKNAIGMAQACEDYGASFFANGAAPGGVLEHPGVIKDPARVRESWTATFGGARNGNKIAVLEEGVKYMPISVSPEQAQFLQTHSSRWVRSPGSSASHPI